MKKYIDVEDVKDLLIGLDSLPWEEEVDDIINPLVAEDVKEVVHAKWLGKPFCGYSTVRCSNCSITFKENSGRWKYCPECGAKMDL